MAITKDTFVSVTYKLRNEENGALVEEATTDRPLEFVVGHKQMLEHFESNLLEKNVGDTFSFKIAAVDAYGEVNPDMVVELPKDIFSEVSKEEMVKGTILPMMDSMGRRLMGKIVKIADDTVTMDFNSEMAGKDLFFEVSVVEARPATDEELEALNHTCGGSCGSCNGGCDHGHDEGCDCGNCH